MMFDLGGIGFQVPGFRCGGFLIEFQFSEEGCFQVTFYTVISEQKIAHTR